MTRINVVEPGELVDKHLLAEYRELPRVFRLARNWADDVSPGVLFEMRGFLPQSYRMGKGHVRFFYDKLLYLSWRQVHLVNECERRGFEVRFTENPRAYWGPRTPNQLWNDWQPDAEAIEVNRARIRARLSS